MDYEFSLWIILRSKFLPQQPLTLAILRGNQSLKIWLVTSEDLGKVYELYPDGGEVYLWCDGE